MKIEKNATLLLSAYEMEAVPILLKHLEFSSDPGSLIESLKLIRIGEGTKTKMF